MGCDIHAWAERKTETGFEALTDVAPFDFRSYGAFGFLANVRNYSAVPPIAERRGFPDDASAEVRADFEDWSSDAHSATWLSIAELLAFDYDQSVEDRRVTRKTSWGLDGGRTAEPGGGEMTTFREFLGAYFFADLDAMQQAGADRVVFWFDN